MNSTCMRTRRTYSTGRSSKTFTVLSGRCFEFAFVVGSVKTSGSGDAIAFNSSLASRKLTDDSRADIDKFTDWNVLTG
jgi:hypothetical protein